MKNLKIFMPLLILAFSGISSRADDTRALNYTYMGPVLAGGIDFVSHSGWSGSEWEEKEIKEWPLAGGFMAAIYSGPFIGDFCLYYSYNFGEDADYGNMLYMARGRYQWKTGDNSGISAGLGLYFESPPSDAEFTSAAGLMLMPGFTADISPSVKFLADIFAAYGQYGRGSSSTALMFGITAAVLFKVGAI